MCVSHLIEELKKQINNESKYLETVKMSLEFSQSNNIFLEFFCEINGEVKKIGLYKKEKGKKK